MVRSFQMAHLLQTCVCFKHTLLLSATVMRHFYFTLLYVSKWHYAWVQRSDGTSTSQVYMSQLDTTRECMCHMPLLLHKCVCFKHISRMRVAARWHFYFTSVYVPNRRHAWGQPSDGTSTSQVCLFQNDIARECNYQMALLIHNVVCVKHTWGGAQLSAGASNSQVCMFQTCMRCECSCLMALLIHKTVWCIQPWDGAQLSYGTGLPHKFVCFEQTSRVRAAVR
jgi:hypothetical protein